MKGSLILSAPRTLLSRHLESLLSRLAASDRFQIFEDLVTVPKSPRIFLGHRREVIPDFLTVDELAGHIPTLSRS